MTAQQLNLLGHVALCCFMAMAFIASCPEPLRSEDDQPLPDRLVYGTDMGTWKDMYRFTFRVLETADEHFYHGCSGYHWPLHGFALEDKILKNRDTALRILGNR